MKLIFYLTLLLVAALSKANESGMREDSGNDDNSVNREDTIAFESFGSPVYGPNNIKSAGLDGKSAYNIPPPALPPSYATYLSGLYGNPYAYGPYNRLNGLPYTLPPSAYTASLLSNPAYASALLSGLGYSGYGGPYFGRSTVPGLGYPGYSAGLGYGFGGLGYPPAALRRGPAALTGIPAPIAGIPPTVPRAASPVPAPIAPVVPAFPNGFTGIRPSDPALYPYRAAPFRPLQGKDGAARYAYGPDGQNLPVY